MDESKQTPFPDDVLAEQLIRFFPAGLVIINEEQEIIHLNSEAERLFQVQAGDLLQKPLDELLPKELRNKHRWYIKDFIQSGDKVRWLKDRDILSGHRQDENLISFMGAITRLQTAHGLRLAIFLRDVTGCRESEHSRRKTERAWQTLTNCQNTVIHAGDETDLLKKICRIVVDDGGYLFAWIGYAKKDNEQTVHPVAFAGEDQDYLQEVRISWGENKFGQGPVGRAIRSNRPAFSRYITEDQQFSPWLEPALKRNFHSVASFPLRVQGRVIGAITFYSPEDKFDQEEVELLTRLAENLSFGISTLRTSILQRENEELLRSNAFVLQERLKELNLLFTISRLQSQEQSSPQEILTQVVQAIPSAWRYDRLAAARISSQEYGDFESDGYRPTPYSMSRPFYLTGKKIGELEVVYTEKPPIQDDDPFLPEEHNLLESIAYQVESIFIHHQVMAEHRKLASAIEQTGENVLITDKEGIIEYVNPAFETTTGFSRQEAVGKKPNIVKSDQHPDEFYKNLWETILSGQVYKDTIINRTKNGSLYYEYKTISPIYDQQGELTHFVAIGKDLTEQLETEGRLQYLASHDPITGLINHREFIKQFNSSIRDASNLKITGALVVFGLDSFKIINELLGRFEGDRILKLLGERLSGVVGSAVARLGGDEFCVFLKEKTPAKISTLVEECLDVLASPLRLEGEDLVVTARAGISWYPDDGRDSQDLLKKAMTAMANAKESKMFRFAYYTPDMQSSSIEFLQLKKTLLKAFDQSWFTIFFQPQLDLNTKDVTGAEVLVRLQSPGSNPISPGEFIPALEEMGQILKLGDFVLNATCTVLKRARDAGLILPRLAVNLAAPQLEDPAFVQKITGSLRAMGLTPENLELEVTESLFISRYHKVQKNLSELEKLGIKVALDDFGTGYSSLQYLTRYPFSKLKIDRTFVWNMVSSKKDYEVVRAIISLGHSLGIKVLAEGVENKEHEKMLMELGCDYVQGYMYSRPVDEKTFLKYLRSG